MSFRKPPNHFNMKKLAYLKTLLWAIFLGSLIIACEEEEEEPPVPVNETPIAPSSTNGRPNKYLGCVEIANRNVDIEVWDHGTIDGDIISLIVNRESGGEETILNRHEFSTATNWTGPAAATPCSTALPAMATTT
jgi:hypothetical protein